MDIPFGNYSLGVFYVHALSISDFFYAFSPAILWHLAFGFKELVFYFLFLF